MRRHFLVGVILTLALSASAAAEYKVGGLQIREPWARATPKGAEVAAGYMTIVNAGTQADRLIGGSTVVAGRFEIHEMAIKEGVMQMRPVAGGLEIKPGMTVELKPGGGVGDPGLDHAQRSGEALGVTRHERHAELRLAGEVVMQAGLGHAELCGDVRVAEAVEAA